MFQWVVANASANIHKAVFGAAAVIAGSAYLECNGLGGGDVITQGRVAEFPGKHLVAAQVVFRHGARLPIVPDHPIVPEDDWDAPPPPFHLKHRLYDLNSPSHTPAEALTNVSQKDYKVLKRGGTPAMLTHVGRDQVEALGRRLRERYADGPENKRILPQSWDPTAVYPRTTLSKRTVASLKGVLSGLYPELNDPTKPPTEVAIVTARRLAETLIPTTASCPRLAELRSEAFRVLAESAEYSRLKAANAQRVGAHVKGFNPVLFHDVIVSRNTHGKPLPEDLSWARHREDGSVSKELRALQEQASKHFLTWAVGTTHEGLTLGLGRLVDEIIWRFDVYLDWQRKHGVQSEASKRTLIPHSSPPYFPRSSHSAALSLYSSHDTCLVLMLRILEVADVGWPEYASSVTFELYEDDTPLHAGSEPRRYVRALYNDTPLRMPWSPGHAELCPLHVFRANMLRYVPQNYSAECVASADKVPPRSGDRPPPTTQPQRASEATASKNKSGLSEKVDDALPR